MLTRGAVVAIATLFYCAAVVAEPGTLVVNVINTLNVPGGIHINHLLDAGVEMRDIDSGAPIALVDDSAALQRLRSGWIPGGAQPCIEPSRG